MSERQKMAEDYHRFDIEMNLSSVIENKSLITVRIPDPEDPYGAFGIDISADYQIEALEWLIEHPIAVKAIGESYRLAKWLLQESNKILHPEDYTEEGE